MSEGVVAIDFGLKESIAGFASREELQNYIGNMSDSYLLWRFARALLIGDWVALPRKLPADPKVVAVGKISGKYEFRPTLEAPHIHPVDWIAKEIPLSDFDWILQHDFAGDETIFTVQRSISALGKKRLTAESRIKEIVAGQLSGTSTVVKVDLGEQIAYRILERIRLRFSGWRLGYLVASVLRASGYHAVETGQGAEGGVDVVAGSGDMGFGGPRLCVQVKSGGSPVDLPDYIRLRDSIGSYGADHGLLVGLGGFTGAVRKENERSFFQIRLWGPFDLAERLLGVYDALPGDIRGDVPLENLKVLTGWQD